MGQQALDSMVEGLRSLIDGLTKQVWSTIISHSLEVLAASARSSLYGLYH
jgi:hypothetical protein